MTLSRKSGSLNLCVLAWKDRCQLTWCPISFLYPKYSMLIFLPKTLTLLQNAVTQGLSFVFCSVLSLKAKL